VAEDPADSNVTGVLDDEDHEQHQRSRQKRCRKVKRGLATVAPGARLAGFWNLRHGGRLPRLPPSKRIVGPPDDLEEPTNLFTCSSVQATSGPSGMGW
jgi:hypothetical protein